MLRRCEDSKRDGGGPTTKNLDKLAGHSKFLLDKTDPKASRTVVVALYTDWRARACTERICTKSEVDEDLRPERFVRKPADSKAQGKQRLKRPLVKYIAEH